MAYNLLRWERDQSYLMPPSMRDWLSEGHLAWFIVECSRPDGSEGVLCSLPK